jgi:hypothetical protein
MVGGCGSRRTPGVLPSLSLGSRRRGFFSPLHHLQRRLLDQLLKVDHHAASTVADGPHGLGIATLRELLASRARLVGIERFVADDPVGQPGRVARLAISSTYECAWQHKRRSHE